MNKQLSYILVPIVFMSFCGVVFCQGESVEPVVESSTESVPDAQLELYSEALINKGSTEQMRLNAAKLLLYSESPHARSILLGILKDVEDISACSAICRTLIDVRSEGKEFPGREEFISPLIEILTSEQDILMTGLAAQATLLFDYDQICDRLENVVNDNSISSRIRLNVMEALKRPNTGAVIQLLYLVDDPDRDVAGGAVSSLNLLGIPSGVSSEERISIIEEIQGMSDDEFLRNWSIRQEVRIRQYRVELDWWRKQLLGSLEKVYVSFKDNGDKGNFLSEQLVSTRKVVRLWALNKVSEKRRSNVPTIPEALGKVVVSLVSDPERDVRLRTAQLLSLIGELDSTDQLIEQLEKEPYADIRIELFVALGVACKHASMSTSAVKVSVSTKVRVLELAGEYLSDSDARKSREGAEVIKNLLEQNGLGSDQISKYLGLLEARYHLEQSQGNGVLRGELLGRMSGLCAQGSVCRIEASKLFGPLFEQGVTDESELVREASVDGLIFTDKTRALRILRKTVVNDTNARIRGKVIVLSGEVGGTKDLEWLWERVGPTEEGNSAWESMLKVFKRSQAVILEAWMVQFNASNGNSKLSDDQKVSFLEMAEQKAVSENNSRMLYDVSQKLADLHLRSSKYEQSARYLGFLYDSVKSQSEKDRILPDLLAVYLRWPNVDRAAGLIDNSLLRGDLGPKSAVVVTIDEYLNTEGAEVEHGKIVGNVLSLVKSGKGKSVWQDQVKRWAEQIGASSSGGNGQGKS
jgi:hypothetical protein